METLDTLLKKVKKANKKQLSSMIYDFEFIGFYREDKRHQRRFVMDCLTSCYTIELNIYGCKDSDSLKMERAVVTAMLLE